MGISNSSLTGMESWRGSERRRLVAGLRDEGRREASAAKAECVDRDEGRPGYGVGAGTGRDE